MCKSLEHACYVGVDVQPIPTTNLVTYVSWASPTRTHLVCDAGVFVGVVGCRMRDPLNQENVTGCARGGKFHRISARLKKTDSPGGYVNNKKNVTVPAYRWDFCLSFFQLPCRARALPVQLAPVQLEIGEI